HLLHLLQKCRPPRLLRVALESRHHRQCPLLAESVHAGMNLSILAVERQHLIRVSLVLFRVIRRGIGISRRLSVTDTVCAYRRLGCSPSNPSVSRTDQPPPEKESGGDGKGSSPETLKRLVLLVSQRRSLLPSSTEST